MEGVDRERVFRKNLTPSWLFSPRKIEEGEVVSVLTEEPSSISEWTESTSSVMTPDNEYQKPLPPLPPGTDTSSLES